MHRKAKRTCVKFIGKALAFGIVSCCLLGFIGPCLSDRFNHAIERMSYSRQLHESRAQADEHQDLANGLQQQQKQQNDHQQQQQNGNSAIQGRKDVLNSFKKFVSAQPKKDEEALQSHSSNIIPAKPSLSYEGAININRNGSSGQGPKQNHNVTSRQALNTVMNATISPPRTQLHDIFIGVKTGAVYHQKRLDLLLQTWITKAQNQTFIFTDQDDDEYEKKVIDGHLINTQCGQDHSRVSLCCKTGVMFDVYMKHNKSWICHLDDDNYLIVENLVKYLQKYNPYKDDVYTGFTQLMKPIQTRDRANPKKLYKFYFGTGGAGYCISRSLILKMQPHVRNGNFVKVCDRIRWPDDMAVGFIVEALTNNTLIKEAKFNSHIEALGNMRRNDIVKQITLSYKIEKNHFKTIHIPNGAFNTTIDPSRFRSLHCMLYPYSAGCPQSAV